MFIAKHNTHAFPKGDTSYLKDFDIERYGKKYWIYKTEDGHGLFGVIRHVNKDGSKRIFQFSYDGEKFINKSKHITNRPLLNAHLLKDLPKDTPILIPEGEKCKDACADIFQEYFVTTWSGGCSNYKKTDWSILKGFTNITLLPDADVGGVQAAEEISWLLDEKYNTQAKVVNLPSYLEAGWDFADEIPQKLNPQQLLAEAQVPPKRTGWEDIDSDIENNRWVFIADSMKLYWCRFSKKMFKEASLNLLYKRNRKKLEMLPVSYLHAHGIDVVDGTAYIPNADEIIREGNTKYLNTFRANFIAPLTMSELEIPTEPIIQGMRDHILNVLCNGNKKTFRYLEDTISFDFQHPERNRTFAWVFSSKQGVGKTLFFNWLTKIHGSINVAWVHTDNLVDKYRSYMKSCYVIVCNEIDISGQGKSSKLDKLKELITEEVHPIEQKYVDTINHKGHYRLWASSNKNIPLNFDSDDRRVSFSNCRITREQLLAKDPDYFKKLWDDVEDWNWIRRIYHFYMTRKISDDFNPNEPIRTQSRDELIAMSRPQAFKDLDDRFEKRLGVFDRDLVNSRDILLDLRSEDDARTTDKRRPMYDRIDEMVIHRWLDSIGAAATWNNQPCSIIGDKKTNRKRYKAIRNIEFWATCTDITLLRAHMRFKYEVGDENRDGFSKEKLILEIDFANGGQGTLVTKAHIPIVSESKNDIF